MAFADPKKIINKLDLTGGSDVADFGAGAGAWTIALAEVLPNGTVYAVDIQKDLLSRVKKEALSKGLSNIHYIWGDLESPGGTKITDRSLDLVVMANILFQTDAKYSVALEASRVLKPNGQVLVVDWEDSFGGLGPRPEDVVTPDEIKKIFNEAGFLFKEKFEAADHHYGMIFIKK